MSRQQQLIDGLLVHPGHTIQNLGVFINTRRFVAQCITVMRHLRLISQVLSPSTLKSRYSYLDWTITNSVLAGLPAYFVKRIQSLLNALAQLIYGHYSTMFPTL